jgi:tripartite-type tricarboxylate transporter receptor subunit TctC
VRALASTGTERNPALPDLPTVADTLAGYEITQSWGIVAPAGTPPDVVKRLGDEFAKALANAEVKDKILKTGAVPASNDSSAAFADFMAKERARLGDVITRSKIELKE